MNEWTVVGVVVTLTGLIAAVVRPMLSLNASITRLNTLLDSMRQELEEFSNRNSRGHDRIWRKLEEQEETLGLHEHRLTVLEEHRP